MEFLSGLLGIFGSVTPLLSALGVTISPAVFSWIGIAMMIFNLFTGGTFGGSNNDNTDNVSGNANAEAVAACQNAISSAESNLSALGLTGCNLGGAEYSKVAQTCIACRDNLDLPAATWDKVTTQCTNLISVCSETTLGTAGSDTGTSNIGGGLLYDDQLNQTFSTLDERNVARVKAGLKMLNLKGEEVSSGAAGIDSAAISCTTKTPMVGVTTTTCSPAP